MAAADEAEPVATAHLMDAHLADAHLAAAAVFGDRLPLAQAYAAALADTGVTHGLIGPRETARLWERHLLNCAVVQELVPPGAVVVDVGAGAGLPGIPLAVARPDLTVVLVEPLLRRTRWLETVVAELGLTTVQVRRARAEELARELSVDVVTSRAVAPLGKLARWCAPLLRTDGVFLAMKGDSAAQEMARDGGDFAAAGLGAVELVRAGVGLVEPPTVVVRAIRIADHPTDRSEAARSVRQPRQPGQPRPGRRSRRR